MNDFIAVKLLLIGVVAVVAGVKAVALGLAHRARRQKILASPDVFEDSALVTLSGTVKLCGEPLIAPLSGRRCVAYGASVRTDREFRAVAMTPFILITRSGSVIVDEATCELPPRGVPVIPRKIERERAFLHRLGIVANTHVTGFDEIVVLEGQKVLVHGIARKEVVLPDGETGFRDAPMRLRLVASAQPITIEFP